MALELFCKLLKETQVSIKKMSSPRKRGSSKMISPYPYSVIPAPASAGTGSGWNPVPLKVNLFLIRLDPSLRWDDFYFTGSQPSLGWREGAGTATTGFYLLGSCFCGNDSDGRGKKLIHFARFQPSQGWRERSRDDRKGKSSCWIPTFVGMTRVGGYERRIWILAFMRTENMNKKVN